GGDADELLDGYAEERMLAARENLAVTDATMRFMVPGTDSERRERDAILLASVEDPAMRAKVNSGRLATPTVYGAPEAGLAGAVLPDAPVEPVRGTSAARLRELVGTARLQLHVGCPPDGAPGDNAVEVIAADAPVPGGRHPVVRDRQGRVAARLQDGAGAIVITVRPDAYVEAVSGRS
ncbi:MAG: pentachlorophenol monooxygenase, partial [Geodermatophilaceae bacterium]|nr:pentachlorophenol monooxygenase [Geodermatophilaceae bacterium]